MSGIGENRKKLKGVKKEFDKAPITEATLPISNELPRDVMEFITSLFPKMAELGKDLESGEASAGLAVNQVKASRDQLLEVSGTDETSDLVQAAFNASGVVAQELEAYGHKVGLMRTKLGAAIGLLGLAREALREYEVEWAAAAEHMSMVAEAELVVIESIDEAIESI